jgi:flagellar basal body rod protein FlgG
MDPIGLMAASGLRTRMDSLDLLANNLANAATGGYKSDGEFYSLYAAPGAGEGAELLDAKMPVVEKTWTDFSQGALRGTNNPTDLALSGNGMFAVNGPSGGVLFTRNGSLQISAAGELATAEGYPLRAVGGGTIPLDSSKEFEVSTDGTVRQAGQTLGQLEIAEFPKGSNLVKIGNSYFRPADATVKPIPAAATEVQQGKVEDSNVAVAHAAVRLIGVMRQFEMLQKAITLGAEMNRKAVEEVARVGA